MAKRQPINISKKAYFIAVAAVFIFSIAVSAYVTNFAPQFARDLRHLSNGVTVVFALMAAYRLISAGYPSWLSYLIPVFFLLAVPFIAIIFALWAGIRSVDPTLELLVLASAVYTIIFLIIVGLLPNRQTVSKVEMDRVSPRDRIEPRF